LAVNCCVDPWAVVTVAGVIVNDEVTVTTVDVTRPLPSVAVAVTVHDPGVAGSVYKPVAEPIEPQVAVQVAGMLDVN
jgi:hypothetical protein